MMPAAACASTAACNVSTEQPFSGPQPQELLVISGALVGSPWLGSPPTGYGARKNSMHSMHLAGEVEFAGPSIMRQAIHFAPGAIPIWLPAPSSPIMVPVVWLPWE